VGEFGSIVIEEVIERSWFRHVFAAMQITAMQMTANSARPIHVGSGSILPCSLCYL
jgi:hypothetical protein